MIRAKIQGFLSPQAIFQIMSKTSDDQLLEVSRCLIVRGQPRARVQATLNEYMRQKRWWGSTRPR